MIPVRVLLSEGCRWWSESPRPGGRWPCLATQLYVVYEQYLSYNRPMTRLRASKARQEFADTLNRVVYGGERIVLARRGRDLAAIVSMDDLELIRALEDRIDLQRARKALKEKGSVAWKEVRAELGL